MSSDRLRRVATRSGQPNVEVKGIPYHSSYDPKREAQKFYAGFSIERADVILHYGWGLGYIGEALRDRLKPTAKVIIFEPDEKLFRLSLTTVDNHVVLQDPRFRFVLGDRVRQFFDDWALEGCQETDEFLWLEWPAAARIDPETAVTLKASFKTRLRDKAANLFTHFQNGGTYFQNVLGNFEFQSDPNAGELFRRFKNVPLVIVSAGPSLDRNVRELRGAGDRCFVLAVDTALRPLLAAGVTPHAVMIADPSELNAKHIAGALPESTYLIAEQAVHASALRSASRRFLFGLGLFPDGLFDKFGFAKSRLEVWGSVATAALDLAIKMGANPVIFAGQDFGFSWGRDYASNTMFDGNPFDPATAGGARELDVWGHEVFTTENLIAYRDYFVRKIRQTRDVRFINASEGGILTQSVEILSLQDALSQCREHFDIPRALEHCCRPSQATSAALDHFSEVLRTERRDCGCLDTYLELTAKESLLNGDREGIERNILWGSKAVQKLI